mgnify:CR=1 FL=1
MQTFLEKCEGLIRNLPEALSLENMEGRILAVNDRATNLLGYTEEELTGKRLSEIVPKGDPIFPPEKITKATKQGSSLESAIRRSDGNRIPVEIRGSVLEGREQDGLVVSIRNISNRKEAEKRYKEVKHFLQSTAEAVQEGISILDPEFNVKFTNSVIENWFDGRGQLDGNKCYRVYHDREEPCDDCPTRKAIETGETQRDVEKGIPGTDVGWVEITSYPVADPDTGEIESVFEYVRDITERKRMETQLKEERRRLKELHDAVDRLQEEPAEERILQTAVEVAEEILDFGICAISILEGEFLVPKANSSRVAPEETATFKIGEGIAGKTIEKGETLWGDDLKNYQEAKPTSEEFRSFISVPIGNLGVFQVISEEVGNFGRRDVEFAEILAGHLSEELKRRRLEEELKEQAIRDPLTGLYNRRYFNETLQKEVQKAERYENPVAFLMTDVNSFKEVNDRYSHQHGDKVLEEMARLLQENVRQADTVVRYGGDEFLVMMPETNGGVSTVISRLQEKLEDWNERTTLIDFPLTLAMGVSHWTPEQNRDIEEALKEADRKMYSNKER